MSLEESMKDLADSNRELASAMRNYAGVMQGIVDRNPDSIITAQVTNTTAAADPQPTTDTAPADKKKGGRKSQADKDAAAKADTAAQAGGADPFADGNADAGEADPFGDDAPPEAPKLTAEAIRGLILRVKNEKSEDAAKKVLAHVGVSTLGQVKEADYQKVVDFCARGGIKL